MIKLHFCSKCKYFIKLEMSKILKTHLQREPYSYYFKIFLSTAWGVWNESTKIPSECSFSKTLLIPQPPMKPHPSQGSPVVWLFCLTLPIQWLAHIPESPPPLAFSTHVPRPASIATKQATNLCLTTTQRRLSASAFIFLKFSWFLGIHH